MYPDEYVPFITLQKALKSGVKVLGRHTDALGRMQVLAISPGNSDVIENWYNIVNDPKNETAPYWFGQLVLTLGRLPGRYNVRMTEQELKRLPERKPKGYI